ncbi:Rrf2 family transcriptional regulator [Cohnella hongkongensis]|uniref:Rrf2 family transcriptional regulator n=1 Tax=Cohnella hongkongensis TaxID=178337 RepID=A0ABV9F8A8_9BACL
MKQISTRFSMAVHTLSLIAVSPNECTGEDIAGSVNTHPVVIRRIMGMLKRAGLVDVRPGVGGASLRREPGRITLLDIYRAVNVTDGDRLFRIHDNPNIDCPVGRGIEQALQRELDEAQTMMERRLERTTLAELIGKLK